MKKAKKIDYITDDRGKKKSVILPVEAYEELLEDIQNLVAVAERRKEKPVPLREMKTRLKQDVLSARC